jgi:hypothetical protein
LVVVLFLLARVAVCRLTVRYGRWGMVGFARQIPALLFVPFAGVLVERAAAMWPVYVEMEVPGDGGGGE